MRYSDFDGISVSKLGFGTMRLPLDEHGSIDFAKGKEMVAAAFKGGINYFDTAYKYHGGESENFCGEALSAYPRDSFLLADKLPPWLCEKAGDAEAILDDQLKKCRTDYFDFYLLHNVDEEVWPTVEKLDLVDFMVKSRASGKARHIGLSVHCKPELLEEILNKHGDALEFVQIQLNYLDWDYIDAKALYGTARKYGKPVIVMEPLRGGMLADLPSPEAKKCIADACRAEGLEPCSDASYGLRFASGLEGVFCTLSGMSSMDQMNENTEIFSGAPLTENQMKAAGEIAGKIRSEAMVPCTSCNYCAECPAGIKIPGIFKFYNDAVARNFVFLWDKASDLYNGLGPNAGDCIGCGNCESHCPQKISIIQKLRDIDAKAAELIAAEK